MTSSSAPPPRLELPASPRHVHLTAIAGVGMASLAGLFREAGYHVTGSDAGIYPPMSTILASLGIPVMEGFRAENLSPRPDLVVVGNAMSRGNPEVEAMLESGIPYCSMPEALMRFFIDARRRAVVTGTHGKTTSSALLAWVLHETGGDPGFMIGGAAKNFPYNFRVGTGPWFVTEGDEYDTAFFDKGPKFLHYAPDALLLTAVEFDHADIYRDLAHVKEAFTELLRRTTGTSPVVVSADFPEARAVAAAIGVPEAGALDAIARFRGVRRRQEVIGSGRGVVLIDDFAHHPTAVAGTLAALRSRYPERRLWALFEPRSNTTRRKVFQEAFATAFGAADRVTFAAVHRRDELPESERLSTPEIVRALVAAGRRAETCEQVDDIRTLVAREARAGDVIVLMSNGGFGGLAAKLLVTLGLDPVP